MPRQFPGARQTLHKFKELKSIASQLFSLAEAGISSSYFKKPTHP